MNFNKTQLFLLSCFFSSITLATTNENPLREIKLVNEYRYIYEADLVSPNEMMLAASDEDDVDDFKTQILDAAKSAILGQFKSLLINALFSKEKTVQYVMLHQDSLDAIDDLIAQNIITSDVEDAKSKLLSFVDLLAYYNETVNNNFPDASALGGLIDLTTSLKNHHAYRKSYNSEKYFLTKSYALVASLTISTLTEKLLQNYISYDYLSYEAHELALTLQQMKSDMSTYISTHVTVSIPDPDCGALWCERYYVHDNISDYTTGFNPRDEDKAFALANTLEDKYRNQFIGFDTGALIYKLENL
jgi:hypothetical protein